MKLKLIYLITLSLLFVQCGSKTDSGNQGSADIEADADDGPVYTKFKNANASFAFPSRYTKYSVREAVALSKTAEFTKDDSFFLHSTIAILQRNPKAEIMVDSDKFFDQIIVEQTNYIPELNNRAFGIGLGMHQTSLEKIFRPFASVTPVDSKIMRGKTAQIAKGQFEIDFGFIKRYLTLYWITAKQRTFTIEIFNETGDDFEESVKRMKIH